MECISSTLPKKLVMPGMESMAPVEGSSEPSHGPCATFVVCASHSAQSTPQGDAARDSPDNEPLVPCGICSPLPLSHRCPKLHTPCRAHALIKCYETWSPSLIQSPQPTSYRPVSNVRSIQIIQGCICGVTESVDKNIINPCPPWSCIWPSICIGKAYGLRRWN